MKPFAPSDKVCYRRKKLSIVRSAPSLSKKKNEIFGHCMHKSDSNQTIPTIIMLSSDEVPIMDRSRLNHDKILAKYS